MLMQCTAKVTKIERTNDRTKITLSQLEKWPFELSVEDAPRVGVGDVVTLQVNVIQDGEHSMPEAGPVKIIRVSDQGNAAFQK